MNELVVAAGVSYRVGEAVLLSDADLSASAGDLVAIVGPNGAGKTTLIRLLAADLVPTSGRVMLAGDLADRLGPDELALRRSVFDDRTPVDIPFTAAAVVALARYPHRTTVGNSAAADQRSVTAAMERMGATHLSNRIYGTLSGGERTRVSLARVFAQETPVVLLDEPTAALDVGHREQLMAEVRTLARQGRAVIAVLHDLNLAAFYADRVVVIAGGTIRADGEPREVLDAGLLSEVYEQPMRVIEHPFRSCPLVLAAD